MRGGARKGNALFRNGVLLGCYGNSKGVKERGMGDKKKRRGEDEGTIDSEADGGLTSAPWMRRRSTP